jgi:hypothetical protein
MPLGRRDILTRRMCMWSKRKLVCNFLLIRLIVGQGSFGSVYKGWVVPNPFFNEIDITRIRVRRLRLKSLTLTMQRTMLTISWRRLLFWRRWTVNTSPGSFSWNAQLMQVLWIIHQRLATVDCDGILWWSKLCRHDETRLYSRGIHCDYSSRGSFGSGISAFRRQNPSWYKRWHTNDGTY